MIRAKRFLNAKYAYVLNFGFHLSFFIYLLILVLLIIFFIIEMRGACFHRGSHVETEACGLRFILHYQKHATPHTHRFLHINKNKHLEHIDIHRIAQVAAGARLGEPARKAPLSRSSRSALTVTITQGVIHYIVARNEIQSNPSSPGATKTATSA